MIKILFITCSLFLACKPSRKEPVIAGSENPNKQYKADDSTVIDLPSQPQVEPQKIEAEKSLEKHVSIDVNDQKNPPPKESITKTETEVETNTVSNGIPKKDVKTEQKKTAAKIDSNGCNGSMSLTKSQVKDLPILKYLNPAQSDEIIGYNEIPSAHFNNMAMENKKESLVEIKKISCLKAEKIEEDLKKTFTDFVEILQVENDPKNYIEGSFKLKFKNLPDTIKSISLYSMNTMVDAGLLQIGAPKESTRKPQEFIKYNLQSNEDFTTNQFDIWPFNTLFAVFNVQDECFIRKITIEI